MRPITDSPIRRARGGPVSRARTGTARDAESTATPMLVTTAGPSASALVPSPLVTVAVSPRWMRLASAGETVVTTGAYGVQDSARIGGARW